MMIKMYLEGGLSGIKESEKSIIGLETCQTPIFKRYISLQFSNPTYELLSWILKAFDWSSLRDLFAKFCHEVCCTDYHVTCIEGTLDRTFIRVGQNFDETDMNKEVRTLMATLFLFGISLGAYVIEQNENATRAHGVNDDAIRNFIESKAAPFGQTNFKQNEARDSIEYILDFVDFVADNEHKIDVVHGVDDFVDFVSNLHKSFRDLRVTAEPVNDDEFNAGKSYIFSQYYTRIHVYAD